MLGKLGIMNPIGRPDLNSEKDFEFKNVHQYNVTIHIAHENDTISNMANNVNI